MNQLPSINLRSLKDFCISTYTFVMRLVSDGTAIAFLSSSGMILNGNNGFI